LFFNSVRLGEEVKRESHKVHSGDFVFTILSYNVLSDQLAKMHPELYIGIFIFNLLSWKRSLLLCVFCFLVKMKSVDQNLIKPFLNRGQQG